MPSQTPTTEEIGASFIYRHIEKHEGDPNYSIIANHVPELAQNGGMVRNPEKTAGVGWIILPT